MKKIFINQEKLKTIIDNSDKLNWLFNDEKNRSLKGFYIPVNSELLEEFEYILRILNEIAVGYRLIKDLEEELEELSELVLDYIDLIDGNREEGIEGSEMPCWINDRLNFIFGRQRKQQQKQFFQAATYNATTEAIIAIYYLLFYFALGELNLEDFQNKTKEQIEIYKDYELDLFTETELIEEIEIEE